MANSSAGGRKNQGTERTPCLPIHASTGRERGPTGSQEERARAPGIDAETLKTMPRFSCHWRDCHLPDLVGPGDLSAKRNPYQYFSVTLSSHVL